MNGILILLLLILAAALPAIIVFFWYQKKNSAVTMPWFLISILAGILSLFAAAIIQRSSVFDHDSFKSVLSGIFIRVAFVEELSRLITLIPLLIMAARHNKKGISFGASIGLVSGLGFAMIENAMHGMADINIILLRIFTAVPIHSACGIRAGAAISVFNKSKGKTIFYFIYAVLVHGTYNLIILSPAYPSFLVFFLAYAVLISTLPLLKTTDSDNEKDQIPTPLTP